MRLVIPLEVERKLHAYVMAVQSEIAGMGKVRFEENGDIVVEDIMIYDQEVTGGTADLSSEALARFMTELVRKGESPKNWVLWWHSHFTFEAFFSGTDTGTIERSTEFDYIISLVVNRARARKCRFDTHRVNGVPLRLTKDNVEIVVGGGDNEVPEEIRTEVREKVHFKSFASSWNGKTYGGSYKGPLGLPEGKDQEREALDWTGKNSQKANGKSSKNSFANNERTRSAGEIILADNPEELDADEIMAIIEVINDQIKHFQNTGQEDSDKCQQLIGERADWNIELAARGTKENVMGFYNDHDKRD